MICVVGLGNVGLPTYRHVSSYFEAVGVDSDTRKIDHPRKYSSIKEAPVCNIYLVCVPTGQVIDVIKEIPDEADLISIESTVPVGTTRKLHFETGLSLVHVPHRYWKEDPVNHGVVQPRVIGAVSHRALEKGVKFYKKLGIPLLKASTVEYVEACKVLENAQRYMEIAWAEELALLCQDNLLDFSELRRLMNSKWNIEVLEARQGIDGECLPLACKLYQQIQRSNPSIIQTAMKVDRKYRRTLT